MFRLLLIIYILILSILNTNKIMYKLKELYHLFSHNIVNEEFDFNTVRIPKNQRPDFNKKANTLRYAHLRQNSYWPIRIPPYKKSCSQYDNRSLNQNKLLGAVSNINKLSNSFEISVNSFYYPNLYYINLKHRNDRLKNIKQQLKFVNYPAHKLHRVSGTYHKDGRVGCGLSHIKALKEGLKQADNYIIILEDDFQWIHSEKKTMDVLKHSIKYDNWNVILLSCNGKSIKYNNYLNKVTNCQTASGYIIKKSYIPQLLINWEKQMHIRQKYHISKTVSYKQYNHVNTAIDISWKSLQHDNWYCTNPLLGKQMPSYSSIEKQFVNYGV